MRKEQTKIQKFNQLGSNILNCKKDINYSYYDAKLFGIIIENKDLQNIIYSPYYGNYIELFDRNEFKTIFHCDKDNLDDLDKIIETIKENFPKEKKNLLENINE